jgi:cytoskeleton-associated protein 5
MHSVHRLTFLTSALFEILRNAGAALGTNSGLAAEHQFKLADLSMRSIWRLTKTLKKSLEADKIYPNELLLDIHEFLLVCSPSFWKERSAKSMQLSDFPLRTVKTIMHELCAILGEDVMNHLTLIPDAQQTYVYSYLNHLLNQKKEREAAPGGSGAGTPTEATNSNVPVVAKPPLKAKAVLSDEDHSFLKNIFQHVSNRDKTKQVCIFSCDVRMIRDLTIVLRHYGIFINSEKSIQTLRN